MRKFTKLEQLAGEVAISVPLRRDKYSYAAAVPWAIIEALRAELETLGVDWKSLREEMKKIEQDRRSRAALDKDAG